VFNKRVHLLVKRILTNIFIFVVCLAHFIVKMELFWLKFRLIGQQCCVKYKLNLGDSWFDSHTFLNQMVALLTGSFSFVFS